MHPPQVVSLPYRLEFAAARLPGVEVLDRTGRDAVTALQCAPGGVVFGVQVVGVIGFRV